MATTTTTTDAAFLQDYYATRTRVDLHNQIEVRVALDDFVRKVAEDLYGYQVDYSDVDRRLVLGYVASAVAGGTAAWAYLRPFDETKLVVIVGVCCYFVLMSIMMYVALYKESGALLVGRKSDPLGLDPDLELRINTDMERYGIAYDIVLECAPWPASRPGSSSGPHQLSRAGVSTTIDQLLDSDGHLVADEILKMLHQVFKQAHAQALGQASDADVNPDKDTKQKRQ